MASSPAAISSGIMGELAKLGIIAACAALAAVCCRQSPHGSLLTCVPDDATLMAGVELSQVRKWPLYERLPAAWRAALAPVEAADSAIMAADSKEFLLAARGRFPTPPSGALMAAPNLAIFGPESCARSAAESYRRGYVAQTEMVKAAESLPSGTPVWLIARGNADLPIPGNLAGFLGILRKARLVTLAVRRDGALQFELHAAAPNLQAATAIEETLRADLTLAAAAEAKRPDVAALFKKAEVTRDGLGVDVRFAAPDDAAARLLGF